MGDRIDEIWKKLTEISSSNARIEEKVDGVIKRFDTFEERYNQKVAGFEALLREYDKRLDDHNERITIIETKMGKYGWKEWIKANKPVIPLTAVISSLIVILGWLISKGIIK